MLTVLTALDVLPLVVAVIVPPAESIVKLPELVSISLSIVAYFALGAKLGISLDAETFVAFFTAAGLMAKPIRQLSSINMTVQKGLAAANEIFEQLDEEIERDIDRI